jgi:hypothetical protein
LASVATLARPIPATIPSATLVDLFMVHPISGQRDSQSPQ